MTETVWRSRWLLCLLGAALGAAAIPASADAAFDKKIVTFDGTEVGSISFPAAEGSSIEGVVFALAGYTQSNLESIMWMIDPTDGSVDSLTLLAVKGDYPCPNGDPAGCSNRTLSMGKDGYSTSTSFCGASSPGGGAACGATFLPGPAISFVDPVPAYTCDGFKGPLAKGPVAIKNKLLAWLRATLRDAGGKRLRGKDLDAEPLLEVEFDAATEAAAAAHGHLPGIGADGTAFVPVGLQWHLLLTLKNLADAGNYTVRMVSGDPSEYHLDPTCEGVFVR